MDKPVVLNISIDNVIKELNLQQSAISVALQKEDHPERRHQLYDAMMHTAAAAQSLHRANQIGGS